jgi:hypothetical protein
MVQLVLDISSEKDAALIEELLKRFKSVEVNNFTASITGTQMRKRIEEGIADADNGNVKPWKEVKAKLLARVKSKAK